MDVIPPPAFVDLSGLRMAYREWGQSDAVQAVVLIHGATGSSLSWNRVGPALAGRRRVLAVDLKGHGDTARPTSGYGFAQQVEELAAFCGALDLGRPAVVGHSWGGAIALQLATSTDLVDRLVLEDPEIGQAGADRQQVAEFVEDLAGWMGLSRDEAQRRAAAEYGETWGVDGVAAKVEAAVKGSPGAVRSNFTENFPWDLHRLLPALRCPTLLVHAAPELGGGVDSDALALAEANAQVRTVLVPGAGHNIHRTHFGEFVALVEPFLAEADS